MERYGIAALYTITNILLLIKSILLLKFNKKSDEIFAYIKKIVVTLHHISKMILLVLTYNLVQELFVEFSYSRLCFVHKSVQAAKVLKIFYINK